jgi:predicted flap endonuclease-1-like 5' DNA nuclease
MSEETIVIHEEDTPAGFVTEAATATTETIVVAGSEVYNVVRRLVHEVNVRRVRLVNKNGKTLLDVPIYAGVAGAALLGYLAAIPLIVAFMAEISIVVERREKKVEADVAEEIVIHDAVPVPADDLQQIKGVGPKTVALLHDAGIRTFADLAATPVPRLKEILDEGGDRFAIIDPESWPEQARQLAEEDA